MPESDDLLIGELALAQELVTPQQLKDCLDELKRANESEEVSSLGKILLERKLIDIPTLGKLLREKNQKLEGLPDLPRYEFRDRLGSGAVAGSRPKGRSLTSV